MQKENLKVKSTFEILFSLGFSTVKTQFAVALLLLLTNAARVSANEGESVETFVQTNCLDCHSGADAEAGFDLASLPLKLTDAKVFSQWVKVFDRVERSEMPPEDTDQPPESERHAFVAGLRDVLSMQNLATQTRDGRVQYRRLNRVEYENTLRDMLALPNLEVREMLPPDSSSDGFDNVGSALDLSYVQISRYLEAANQAIDQALAFDAATSVSKSSIGGENERTLLTGLAERRGSRADR